MEVFKMSKIKIFDEHILTGSESAESILNRIIKNSKKRNKKSKDQDDSKESQKKVK